MKVFLKKLFYTLMFIAFFSYGVYTIAEQQIAINNLRTEKEKYTSLCENEEMQYEKLVETKQKLSSDEYIEEVAREKLGLVMPYEIIFVDASI